MSDTFEPYDDMPVHDDHVPEDLFAAFVEHMPQVCVDLILETREGSLSLPSRRVTTRPLRCLRRPTL